MRIIALFIAVISVASCATNAENQFETTNNALLGVSKQTIGCYDTLDADSRFSLLSKHLPKDTNDATIEQLSDTRKPTAQEAKLLTEYVNQAKICRKIAINGHTSVMPQMVPILQENSDRKDDVYVQLIKQQLSWGDALKIIKSINTETAQKEMNVKSSIYSSLEQQHNAEISQRQRAAMVMQNAGYQQQMLYQNQQVINNINRPINTTCNSFGTTVNCTSR